MDIHIEWPRISVIMPVRNAEKTIARAIDSLLEQNYPNMEFFVLDAASTDNTVEIIKKYEQHITFWRSHRDGGAAVAYNEGIERATGDIIAFLNADDWYEYGILKAVGEEFLKNPVLDMVTCKARVVVAEGESFRQTKVFEGKSLTVSHLATPIPNARFFNRTIFLRYGKLMTHLDDGKPFIGQDLEFIFRLSLHKLTNRILDFIGYTYLAHEDSMTFGQDLEMTKRLYKERVFIAEKFLEQRDRIAPEGIKRLKCWHRRGTVRLYLWHLADGNKSAAEKMQEKGVQASPILWRLDVFRLCLQMMLGDRIK